MDLPRFGQQMVEKHVSPWKNMALLWVKTKKSIGMSASPIDIYELLYNIQWIGFGQNCQITMVLKPPNIQMLTVEFP